MTLKTYFKFLGRRKLYTFINLFGLGVSLMFVILIANYGLLMLDVDRSYSRSKDIVLVGAGEQKYGASYSTLDMLAPMLPEVEKKCAVMGDGELKVYYQDKEAFSNSSFLLVDSTFFDFFEYPFLHGTPAGALEGRNNAVITESLAMKLYGRTQAVGEPLTVQQNEEELIFTVTGVIKDLSRTVIPHDTEIFLNSQNTTRVGSYDFFSPHMIVMGNPCCKTFLMLHKGTSLDHRKEEIKDYYLEHDLAFVHFTQTKEIYITPLTQLMLDPHNEAIGLEKGNESILRLLLCAGIILLLFAVTNYINLTVAQTGYRAKEMACRRLLGDSQGGIMWRMVLEATLMTFVAFLLGFFLALQFEDKMSELVLTPIHVMDRLDGPMIAGYGLFVLLLGLISGALPAYAISRFKPIEIVKGSFRYRSKMVFSKVFIFVQYAVTLVMIICSTTMYWQIKHLCDAPLGHNKEDIIEAITYVPSASYAKVRHELMSLPFVEEVGCTRRTLFFQQNRTVLSIKDAQGNVKRLYQIELDQQAIDLLGLELIEDFHPASKAYYFTEAGAREMILEPGQTHFTIKAEEEPALLGGIYKDFRLGTILEPAAPIMIEVFDPTIEPQVPMTLNLYIKVNGNQAHALEILQETLEKVTGNKRFYLKWAEDVIKEQFKEEQSLLDIILIFTAIALFVALLGLYAISAYFTQQREKEMGLRKIFGGSRGELIRKQLRQLSRPLLVAIVVALPLSYYLMEQWLNHYNYRITQRPLLYVAALLLLTLIALATLLVETLRVTSQNPIRAIQKE